MQVLSLLHTIIPRDSIIYQPILDTDDEASDHESDISSVGTDLDEMVLALEEVNEMSLQFGPQSVNNLTSLQSYHDLRNGEEIDLQIDETIFYENYMLTFTASFGEELNEFRNEPNFQREDIDGLVQCIKSNGMVLSSIEKRSVVDNSNVQGKKKK